MVADVVKDLGYLTLGTRLKRLGERLQAQSQVLLDHAGLEIPASYFPLLAALDRLGALSVGELSEAVGITQPGVTRMLDKLQAEDLVKSAPSADDGRVRTIALTATGRQVIAKAKRLVWPMVEAAVADACAHPSHELLELLAKLEEALAATPLHTRAERLRSGKKRHAST
jgi:DNA-binding MarR family transcriptional regulator